MTSSEALSGLVSIVGSGGIVSVIIAYLGLKQEALKGGRPTDSKSVAVAIGDVYGDKREREALTLAIVQLKDAILKQTEFMEQTSERKERDRELKVLISEMQKERHRNRDD